CHPYLARFRHAPLGYHHPRSGFSTPLGSTSPPGTLDHADLALRLGHRRLRLPHALPMVSSAESCTSALVIVCSRLQREGTIRIWSRSRRLTNRTKQSV